MAGNYREPDGFRKDTDQLMTMLEGRLIALEKVAATRWPMRMLAVRKLSRSLRIAARPYGGPFEMAQLEVGTAIFLGQPSSAFGCLGDEGSPAGPHD